MAKNDRRKGESDPYKADSDKEYAALEADQVEAGDTVDPDVVVAPGLVEGAPEQAYPAAEETARRERELQSMLEESINRDPEALAADQARRHSDDPLGDLTPEARRALDRTPEFRTDDFDDEDLME